MPDGRLAPYAEESVMLDEAILVPLGFFAMIAAVVIVPRYFKSLERRKLLDTLRSALDGGQAVSADTVDAIVRDLRPAPSPERDLRLGVIWVSAGLGLAVMGALVGSFEPDALYPTIGAAALPVFIGLGFILISLLSRRR